MRFTTLIPFIALPASLVAAPAPNNYDITFRAACPTKPQPCVRVTTTSTNETHARFDKFAQAFIYKKNITEAFAYIAKDYINGFDSAWNILCPIWGSQSIAPLRTTFNESRITGWLNYRTVSFGEVVDRFRWEGGCIAEHWDQGEKYPTKR